MLLRANVGGDSVILGDGTLFFKVTPTPEESIMGNEEQMSRVPLPEELLAIIAQRYGLSLGQARQLDGGDECLVWSVPSHQSPLVVRNSPCWRSPERLAWTHRLMLSLQAVLPQVIAPLRALDGSTLFRYNDRSVALFPSVAGVPFDRENPKLAKRKLRFWHVCMPLC